MERLFGTDGIRGMTEYSSEEKGQLRLTPELVLRIGYAVGRLVRQRLAGAARNCVIMGRDPRISGMMLESAMTAGLLAQGIDVVQVGVIPTPGIAFLTRRLSVQLGVVISASHNPVSDNGIKFFGPDGYKVDDELERHLESLVLNSDLAFTPCNTRELGRIEVNPTLQQMYIDYLVQNWQPRKDLSGLSVLLECANGATASVAPEVFRRLGARIEVVSGTPDGLNINESYEYIEPRRFSKLVLEKGADIGVAFDGDGDRVILIDELGQVVDGDGIMAVLARDMLARDKLPGHTVVTTNMSNFGLHDSLGEIGVRVIETRVGDRFVLAEMLKNGYTLGGERSGHVLVLDREQTTGDGIYTALAVMAVMVDQTGGRLSELTSAIMPKYPQFIESATVSSKPPLARIIGVQETLEQLRSRLGPAVDINLRYSGTEDKIRLSVRGWRDDSSDLIAKEARVALQRIAQIVSSVE